MSRLQLPKLQIQFQSNDRFGSRLCGNSDLSIVRKNPTAQNGPQSTSGASGDILQLPKTRAVGVFTQPRRKADAQILWGLLRGLDSARPSKDGAERGKRAAPCLYCNQ